MYKIQYNNTNTNTNTNNTNTIISWYHEVLSKSKLAS